jgi:hypothetical protein
VLFSDGTTSTDTASIAPYTPAKAVFLGAARC